MKKSLYVVLGLGKTGWSCVRYLTNKQHHVIAMDEAYKSSIITKAIEFLPEGNVLVGGFDDLIIAKADVIVVSPGIAPHNIVIKNAIARGQKIITDLDLFAEVVTVPYFMVTGTNGKSTVVSLLAHLLSFANYKVKVCGNIGTPVLDCVDLEVDYLIVEVSSYSLYYASNFSPKVAVVLNLGLDHLNWHGDLAAYHQAKNKIYDFSQMKVVNLDHHEIKAQDQAKQSSFGKQNNADWQLLADGSISYLDDVIIKSKDYDQGCAGLQANIAASLAMINLIVKIDFSTLRQSVRCFKGIQHRCQLLGGVNGSLFVNDSKATNLHATFAAVSACNRKYNKPIVLLLGGVLKHENWQEGLYKLNKLADHLVFFGQGGEFLSRLADEGKINYSLFSSLNEAIVWVKHGVQKGGLVLLSPGGASFDEFVDFAARGDFFTDKVKLM